MLFKVRELGGEPPAVSITGVDHDFKDLLPARAKVESLAAEGVKSTLTVWLGSVHPVEAAPILSAIDAAAEARTVEWAERNYPEFSGLREPPTPDDAEDFAAYMQERAEAKLASYGEVVDEMRR